MINKEKYDSLANKEHALPSGMAIIPSKDLNFESILIQNSLTNNKNFTLKAFSPISDFGLGESAYNAQIEYENNIYSIDIYVDLVNNLHLQEYRFGNTVDQKFVELATKQVYFIGTSMSFGEDALESFHLQLKILNALVPDASLCVDFMSMKLLSPQWLSMTAKSSIPPSPDYLYTIHAVYNDEPDGRHYWLHTHGLHRCGSVELEMVNITQYPEEMNTMLNMVAKRFLPGQIKEQERFMIGYDGMGIDLCWLRWEKALKDFADDAIGGFNDRKDENDVHAEPVGVLYAVQEGNMVSPEIYGATLAENPIYYISNEETHRMSCLAKERFGFYAELFDKYAPKEEKKSFLSKLFGSKNNESAQSSWRFLVKLGLNVDDENSGSEKEHLWYDVLAINGNKITGRLLNQPYWISGLNEGDIKTYPMELLTDWLIYGPESTYTSDTIYELGYK